MKSISVALLMLCCSSAAANAGGAMSKAALKAGGHPIEKIIDLLKDLKKETVGIMETEEVAYGKFTYWCSTSSAELKEAIAEEKEGIDELADFIDAKAKDIKTFESEIAKLEDQIGVLDSEALAAKKKRKKENDLYNDEHDTLQKTIMGVRGCIRALEGAEKTTESLLNQKREVRKVVALLQMSSYKPDVEAAGDLEAHVDKYDFKSENVIELLKNLLLKFEDDSTAVTKAETNAVNGYELAKQAREEEIYAAEKSKEKKEKFNAKAKKDKTQAEKDKSGLEDDLKADSDTLTDTTSSCTIKKSEYEARTATQSAEIEALDIAVKILAKVTGVRTEPTDNPVPPPSPTDFLQLYQVSSSKTDPKQKAMNLLKETAEEFHSKAIERLNQEVSVKIKDGHFDQVVNMIEKMIFRLMDEQKQEDEHKHWCDQEIEKTETMIDDKEDKIKELKAEIDEQKTKVKSLLDDIVAARKMIADIVGFQKEATEIREIGKKENKISIKDAEDAQNALANAIAVLTEHYKESGEVPKEAWEFLQKGNKPMELPKNPATWGSPYTGVSDPKKQPGGIITIMETCSKDFSEMEADTKAQEAKDQEEYEKVMQENDIEKARRTKENEMKTQESESRNEKIASLEGSKKNVEGELEKTEQYEKDLQPACVDTDKGASYDDRKASRTKEIKALQKAQDMLQTAFDEKGSLIQKSSLRGVSRH